MKPQTRWQQFLRRSGKPLHGVLVGLLVVQMATPCQAGLFDWLFGRRPTTVVCQQPANSCNSCCGERTIVNYAPQTVYTTNWVRVPVTTYRPVATTDPTTCCRVNYMQPTTSYVWQARRQPHVVYKPFMSRIANACNSCQTGATLPIPGYAPAGSIGSGISAPGSLGAIVTSPGPAPSMAPGAAPYAGSPYPASPYGNGAILAPGTVAPTTVAPNGAGLQPADTRPSLDPGAIVPQVNQRPTLDSSYLSPAYATPNYTAPYATPSYSSGPYTDYSTDYSTSAPTLAPPTDQSITTQRPATPPRASTEPYTKPLMTAPAAPGAKGSNNTDDGSATDNGAAPNPVPDPDAGARGQGPTWSPPTIRVPPVPRLLNPSDRTAALRPRMAAPVSWAKVRRAVYGGATVRPVQDDIQQPRQVPMTAAPQHAPSAKVESSDANGNSTESRGMTPVRLPNRPQPGSLRLINDPSMAPIGGTGS